MGIAFRGERNFRIQLAVALIAIVAASVLPLSNSERLLVLVVAMSVLVLELLNTTVERLVDLMKPRLADVAGEIKDLMAAAVLLAAAFAAVIGAMVFWPYLVPMLRHV